MRFILFYIRIHYVKPHNPLVIIQLKLNNSTGEFSGVISDLFIENHFIIKILFNMIHV